jgi:hypothetical protein
VTASDDDSPTDGRTSPAVSFAGEVPGASLPQRRGSVRGGGSRLVRRSTSVRRPGSGADGSGSFPTRDSRAVFYESLLGRQLKRILDEPESSAAAFWYSVLSNTIVVVSVIIMFISTVKSYHR